MLSTSRHLKAAAASLRRLQKKLDHIVQTRLPRWLHEERSTVADEARTTPLPAERSLAEKRERAEQAVEHFASLMAANAFNPVPVLDVGLDVRILNAMSEAVADAYGLNRDSVTPSDTELARAAWVNQAADQIADRFAPHAAERVAHFIVSKFGVELITRQASKWLPFVGALVCARIGYRVASGFGRKLLEGCEAAASLPLSCRFGQAGIGEIQRPRPEAVRPGPSL
jgi:hypothetical protein